MVSALLGSSRSRRCRKRPRRDVPATEGLVDATTKPSASRTLSDPTPERPEYVASSTSDHSWRCAPGPPTPAPCTASWLIADSMAPNVLLQGSETGSEPCREREC